MKLKDLREKRSRLVGEMRTLAEKADGDMTADDEKRFDELKGEVGDLDKRIQRQEFIDQADREAEGERITGTGDDRFDDEVRSFSIRRAMAASIPDLNIDAGREREVSQELARRSGLRPEGILVPMAALEERVITTTNPGAGPGSNLVATDHMGNMYIDRLRAKLRTRQLGARILNGLVGDVSIPKLKASGTAAWVAENAAISAADQQFESITMAPKHAGAISEYSRNMLLQTSPDIESLIRADFASLLAEAVDSVAIDGGGSNEPDGILQTSGIGSVAMGTNGAAVDWDSVIDLIAELEIDDAEGQAFLTNPQVVKSARKTPKVSSTDSVMVMESPRELAGYPLASTTLVPSDGTKGSGTDLSTLIFGNFSDLLIGYWSAFDLLVNPYESTAYTKGNVSVRAMLTCDVAVRHPESFAAITDLVT